MQTVIPSLTMKTGTQISWVVVMHTGPCAQCLACASKIKSCCYCGDNWSVKLKSWAVFLLHHSVRFLHKCPVCQWDVIALSRSFALLLFARWTCSFRGVWPLVQIPQSLGPLPSTVTGHPGGHHQALQHCPLVLRGYAPNLRVPWFILECLLTLRGPISLRSHWHLLWNIVYLLFADLGPLIF